MDHVKNGKHLKRPTPLGNPADFELGSAQSRAAARAMAEADTQEHESLVVVDHIGSDQGPCTCRRYFYSDPETGAQRIMTIVELKSGGGVSNQGSEIRRFIDATPVNGQTYESTIPFNGRVELRPLEFGDLPMPTRTDLTADRKPNVQPLPAEERVQIEPRSPDAENQAPPSASESESLEDQDRGATRRMDDYMQQRRRIVRRRGMRRV